MFSCSLVLLLSCSLALILFHCHCFMNSFFFKHGKMGRKFHCFDKQRDVKTQTCNFKKTYKTIFCLKCFNETQGEVVNWKNLFKQAVSSYGIPTSCFKTLSHLRGPCKLYCHVEKDLSNQNLNLLKLSKYI